MMKKLWSVIFAVAMVIGMLPAMAMGVSAESIYDPSHFETSGDFIYIPSQYTHYPKEGEAELVEYRGSASNLTVPSTLGGYKLTSIGMTAFQGNNMLTSVTLPNGMKRIDIQAFNGCGSLKTVVLPSSTTEFGMLAFAGCKSLTDITIPEGTTEVAFYMFIGGTALKNITIPESVTKIGYQAFFDCDSLTKMTIPKNVAEIRGRAFGSCDSLTAINVDKANTSYCDVDGVLFTKDMKTLVQYPCAKRGAYVVPAGVEEINAYAFMENKSLTSMVIPKSVTGIGVQAFDDCDSLTDIYYAGTKAQWDSVTNKYGTKITATVHYDWPVADITAQSATAAYASKDQVASVKVTAKGSGLSYVWYVKNPGQTKYSKSSITSNTYKSKMTPTNSGRLVYCIVKDKYGYEARSKTFELRMKASITSESATAAYAKKGAKVSVKVGAVGNGLTYTWYFKNADGTKYSKSSIKTATYTALMSDTVKGRRVYCVVKDKYGKTVQSKTFILREAVSITTQPKTSATAKGAIAKATVKASGDGLTYAWYIKNAGQTKYAKSSVTKATYSTTMNSTSQNRLVYCVVKDKYGKTVQSNTVQLKMK